VFRFDRQASPIASAAFTRELLKVGSASRQPASQGRHLCDRWLL